VDDVALPEKRARLSVLQSLQKRITLENNKARLGKIVEVLVDGPSPRHDHQVFRRTTHNVIVNFAGPSSLIGSTVAVKVTRANQNSLTGELT
ncbi:MAG TPA: TRAM domain-containing protein, partial [Deltaproteobacteria bacterium]|nr:TRAM domain-containing protein [Deltaproteobacteria bacterium]